MNTRRKLVIAIGAIGAGALVAPFGCLAQLVKVPRIGFLGFAPASAWASQIEALQAGLRDLGYVEGKNIFLIRCWTSYHGLFALRVMVRGIDV